MSISEPWEDLLASEQAFVSKRMALHRSGLEIPQLRLAFAHPQGAEMALRYVRYATTDLVVALLPEIVEQALITDSQISLAREILSRVDPAIVRPVAAEIIPRLQAMPDVSAYEYRKIIETLLFLGDETEKREVIESARDSGDPELQDLAREYGVQSD